MGFNYLTCNIIFKKNNFQQLSDTHIKIIFNNKEHDFKLTILNDTNESKNEEAKKELVTVENILNNINILNTNKIIECIFLTSELLQRENNKYYVYNFTDSETNNAMLLCQFAIKLMLNLNNLDWDKKTIDKIWQYNEYDFYIHDLFIGTNDCIFALNVINKIINSNTLQFHKN